MSLAPALTQAWRAGPGKRRWTQACVDGKLVYAVGDIHGRYDLLVPLLQAITRDVAALSQPQAPLIVFCGDYVDRGPDSARVLEALVSLEASSPFEVKFLMGNHERALLEFLVDPASGRPWLDFGGSETLESYGVSSPAESDGEEGLRRAAAQLEARLPASHLEFLDRLDLFHQIGDYLFVHAGLRAGVPLGKQHPHDLLWIRDAFISDAGSFDKVVVHGHTWIDDQPRLLQHRVGIDTGAYATGVLTAVRIQDHDMTVVQVRGAPGVRH